MATPTDLSTDLAPIAAGEWTCRCGRRHANQSTLPRHAAGMSLAEILDVAIEHSAGTCACGAALREGSGRTIVTYPIPDSELALTAIYSGEPGQRQRAALALSRSVGSSLAGTGLRLVVGTTDMEVALRAGQATSLRAAVADMLMAVRLGAEGLALPAGAGVAVAAARDHEVAADRAAGLGVQPDVVLTLAEASLVVERLLDWPDDVDPCQLHLVVDRTQVAARVDRLASARGSEISWPSDRARISVRGTDPRITEVLDPVDALARAFCRGHDLAVGLADAVSAAGANVRSRQEALTDIESLAGLAHVELIESGTYARVTHAGRQWRLSLAAFAILSRQLRRKLIRIELDRGGVPPGAEARSPDLPTERS